MGWMILMGNSKIIVIRLKICELKSPITTVLQISSVPLSCEDGVHVA